MSKPFFLAKAGQIYGPYDRSEIETLRESGDYEKYTWFWDDATARWQPIDPPPASPRASTQAQEQSQHQHQHQHQHQPQATPAHQAWSVSPEKLRTISAICHDPQRVATGKHSKFPGSRFRR